MPYERRGKCVYNKETGEKKGCSSTEEKAESYLKALLSNTKNESKFNSKVHEILESMEILEEKKYANWLDQKGRKVYPGILSMKQMKRVLKKKIGYFQKGGHIYSLPLIPTQGKIQKEFKKVYLRTFQARPML